MQTAAVELEETRSLVITLANVAVKRDQELLGQEAKVHELRKNRNFDVTEHQRNWGILLAHELQARNINWCSKCGEIYDIPPKEFVFVTGTKEVGSSETGYGTRGFAELHHACEECQQKFFDEHGTRGVETCFYAFRAEKREDGFWARKFGEWTKLTDKEAEQRPFHTLDNEAQRRICVACEMPPRVVIEGLSLRTETF